MKKSTLLVIFGLLIAILFTHKVLTNDGSNSLLPRAQAKAQSKLHKLPDFADILDVKEKKETFFATLYPIIQEENTHVLKVRDTLLRLNDVPVEQLDEEQKQWLIEISSYYRLENESISRDTFDELLVRVDYIPPSLALTQAAIESGWGSSRFSKKGNNLFGQWCFSKGCGMVPSSRDSGKSHEVATFSTVNQAVRAYIRNLNTNAAYVSLRAKRAQLRQRGEPITGVTLAQTLTKYSEEGAHYVRKVTKFINQNKLQRFTTQFEQSLTVAAAE
jgi:Bax protein